MIQTAESAILKWENTKLFKKEVIILWKEACLLQVWKTFAVLEFVGPG